MRKSAPVWLKAATMVVLAYETPAILRDLVQGANRDNRFPTVSVFVGRQHAAVRGAFVALLVGGLFVHLVPEILELACGSAKNA